MNGKLSCVAILVFLGLAAACTSDTSPTPDMVEVLGGQSPVQRLEIGARVLKSLADAGFPDLSCTGDAASTPRCADAVTPYEFLVRVVHNEDMSKVYVQCQVTDASDHPGLVDTCMSRVRAELEQ